MMSYFVSTLFFFVVVLVVYLVSKKWMKIDVGRWGLFGMALILVHQTRKIPTSGWAIYGLVGSIVGIFLIVFSVVRAERRARVAGSQ